MITIKTERLLLEPLGSRHLQTVHQYVSDYENTKYMVHLPNNSIEETAAFLQGVEEEWMSDAPSFYEFAVIYKGKQIGAVSIYLNKDMSGELGWIISKEYWGQGIAYEAAKVLLEHAVKHLQIKHFIAHCDSENIASYKIMEKLGMVRTGVYGGRKNKSSDEERLEYQYELSVSPS